MMLMVMKVVVVVMMMVIKVVVGVMMMGVMLKKQTMFGQR